jgi:hypothetical protein
MAQKHLQQERLARRESRDGFLLYERRGQLRAVTDHIEAKGILRGFANGKRDRQHKLICVWILSHEL